MPRFYLGVLPGDFLTGVFEDGVFLAGVFEDGVLAGVFACFFAAFTGVLDGVFEGVFTLTTFTSSSPEPESPPESSPESSSSTCMRFLFAALSFPMSTLLAADLATVCLPPPARAEASIAMHSAGTSPGAKKVLSLTLTTRHGRLPAKILMLCPTLSAACTSSPLSCACPFAASTCTETPCRAASPALSDTDSAALSSASVLLAVQQ
mmetsp:Transcript_82446/g.120801  ORF Transcript_82446/g.120801 Transcript_82446/m.120801 type:complete len:207 (-) Transcript_82446:325-945(-)